MRKFCFKCKKNLFESQGILVLNNLYRGGSVWYCDKCLDLDSRYIFKCDCCLKYFIFVSFDYYKYDGNGYCCIDCYNSYVIAKCNYCKDFVFSFQDYHKDDNLDYYHFSCLKEVYKNSKVRD